MRKNKAPNRRRETALSRTHLLGLLVGFTILVLANSCATPPPTRTLISNYYVDGAHGSDSNPGFQNLPWQTIQKAADTLSPGDTVTVIEGNFAERIQVSRSGTTEAPIIFQAEGTVTMNGFTINADHIEVKNFEINNTENDSASGWGINIQGSNCVIENNYIHDATRGGILISAIAGSETLVTNCTIKNNRLYHNSQVGIEVHGRNHTIEENEIWGTIQYHPKWENSPSWVDADGVRFFGSGHVFRGNYIHDISIDDPQNIDPHIDAFQTWDDQWGEVGSDSIFEQNKIILGKTATGFQLEGGVHNIIIRNNIVNSFRGVLTYKNGNSPYTSPSDIFVLNNLFIGDLVYLLEENPAGMLIVDTANAVIKNNIIVEQRGQTIETYSSSVDIDYNLFHNSDGSTPLGTPYIHDIWGINPLFVNPDIGDFHLQAESSAIDVGAILKNVTNDLDGVLRPQGNGFDIGPYEHIP